MYKLILSICVVMTSMCGSALELSEFFDQEGAIFKRTGVSFAQNSSFNRFEWTTDKENEFRYFSREGGRSGISFLDQPSQEVNLRFKDSYFNSALIYVYNNADCPPIRIEKKFDAMREEMTKRITEWTKAKAGKISRTRAGGATEYSQDWQFGPYLLSMTWSDTGKGHNYRANYLNIFVDKYVKGKKKTEGIPGKLLVKNVVKQDSGNVFIDNIPMVDQGPKGYCAVAGAARIFRYYGFETDMHRLANLAGSNADEGTRSDDMFDKMRRLSSLYSTKMIEYKKFDKKRFIADIKGYNSYAKKEHGPIVNLYGSMNPYEVFDPEIFLRYKTEKQKTDMKRFYSRIKENVKKGIPVIWTVQLGLYKEPKLNPQAFGGHLRLIIGYNEKTEEILFSDTWGRGHELKNIGLREAWAQTKQYAVLQKK